MAKSAVSAKYSMSLPEGDPPALVSASTNQGQHQPSRVLYGTITSQYNTIPASAATILEGAALHCRIRAFEDCQSLLDSVDPELRLHPVVAYEQFQCYWSQWRLLESAKVLEDALHWAKKSGKNAQVYGIFTLLRITLGKAEVFTKGDFTRARDSMREVKKWLRSLPYEQYTDVQISCLSHYYFLILAANHVTDNFNHESFCEIPVIPGNEDELNIARLRKYLQDYSRLQDARLILNLEVFFLPNETAKQEACRSFLAACGRAKGSGMWAIESAARSMLATALRRAGDLAAAEQEANVAMALLDQAPVPSHKNKAYLSVTLDQLKAATYTNNRECIEIWIRFCGNASVKADASLLSTALGRIADAALEILQTTPSNENKATFWKWQHQYEDILERSGDVYFLYLTRMSKGQAAYSLFDEVGAIFRWQEEFQARYPNFMLWTLLAAGKRALIPYYVRLESQEQVLQTFREINEIVRRRDSFWNEGACEDEQYSPHNDRNLDLISQREDVTGTSTDRNPQLPRIPVDLKGEWFYEWMDTSVIGIGQDRAYHVALGPQVSEGIDPYMSTLLRWLKCALVNRELSTNDLSCLLISLGSEKKGQEVNISKIVEESTPHTVREHLYGPNMNPTSSIRWDQVFPVLKNWLLRRAPYNQTKRHIILGRLQVEMLASALRAVRYQDILKEAQRLLDLIPVLCEEAQGQLQSSTVNWRNIACTAKRILLAQQSPDILKNEEHPGFREVLDLYKVSLKECRDRGDQVNEAATLLFIAQHYYDGAFALRSAALGAFFQYLDESDTIYNKTREGWKVLKGWTKVEKLLSAVQERQRLMIAPLATSVLCQFSDEHIRAHGLWIAIQMAKSNGLGWLMRGAHSTEEGPTDDPKILDVNQEKLPTLTPEDFKPMSDDAGGNIVYVDWYNGSFGGLDMPNPIIVTMDSSGSLRASAVSMTWKDINTIIDAFSFEESDLRKADALEALQRLNPLLGDLVTVTQPGQTLVFSPVGALHRIPLHALSLEGEPLIRRNPIVYCSSLTVLDAVFKARKRAEAGLSFEKQAFLAALFGDPPSQPGRKVLRTLAESFSTEAQIGDASTSSNFIEAIVKPELNLLHYHGHVTFREGDPKDHGLELDDRRFNLRDVFDLAPLPNSYHATLLGCGSGMSRTTISNDVLGLVPAFLYSGAASTISTLWPFDDKDAAMYTRHFYEDFHQILQSGRKGTVDLARANQKAVLAIMKKRPALYHWASFVLNGYWMLGLPGEPEGPVSSSAMATPADFGKAHDTANIQK